MEPMRLFAGMACDEWGGPGGPAGFVYALEAMRLFSGMACDQWGGPVERAGL